ncbi:hypothetical protein BJ508DRAFT_418034 [Ascobolus immersus RN42]|uniref:Uncharacterized protein n=1 Tax=Ascobolus immersus RN42 TaxID=1160509 RepID=A0A3N4HUW3_ASCIM|nr:hypothetical protein BJ508DRAFT_418034 [Ascobolus immersus RN42]
MRELGIVGQTSRREGEDGKDGCLFGEVVDRWGSLECLWNGMGLDSLSVGDGRGGINTTMNSAGTPRMRNDMMPQQMGIGMGMHAQWIVGFENYSAGRGWISDRGEVRVGDGDCLDMPDGDF